MKNPKDLRAKADQLDEEARGLRSEADDLESDASKLRKEAEKIEKNAAEHFIPALKSLWSAMETACVTWFELSCVRDAIDDPSGIESEQRNRILILGRQYLGLNLDLPDAW